MSGKVILVGAGPGDPGLLTIKGQEALKRAQVVVYDRLVSPGILQKISPQAKRINVGKEASHHPVPQDEINQILLKEAQRGQLVVRLKGGDPFLFGRGGEELELLKVHGIPFEVVPGVTSALSVPAYGGIPVTHRDFCSSLHIITGHARAGKELEIDFEALVRTGGTLIFLMGVTALPKICDGLMKAGISSDMPAAIIEQGTTPGQRRVSATVETLVEEAKKANIKSPAISIFGKVCSLAEDFDWYGRLPLKGARIVVTRPKQRIGTLAEGLLNLGAEVFEYPCIETETIQPCPDLDKALEQIDNYQWLVFTSPAGVETLGAALEARRQDVRILGRIKLAAIGPGTAKALGQIGLRADLFPDVYDAAHLGKALVKVATGPALILRAEMGSPELTAALNEAKLPYDDIKIYRTVYRNGDAERLRDLITAGKIDYVTFTSASTVTGFVRSMGTSLDFSLVRGLCIGEQTAEKASRHGIQTIISEKATIPSMLQALISDRCVDSAQIQVDGNP